MICFIVLKKKRAVVVEQNIKENGGDDRLKDTERKVKNVVQDDIQDDIKIKINQI